MASLRIDHSSHASICQGTRPHWPWIALSLSLAVGGAADAPEACAAVRNATSFGAIPGDGRDDLAAINSAINASSAGDLVVLPTGVVSIAGSIVAKTGVSIVGAGRDTTIVRYIGGAGHPMVQMGDVSHVRLSHFTLDGNNSVYALQGINAYGGTGHNLHDLAIKNFVANADFGPHAVYFSSGVTNSRIANNVISNIGVNSVWGSGIRMNGGSSGNQVLDNRITNTGRGGIFAAASTDQVIRNNVVDNSGRAAGAPGLGIEVWGGSHRSLIENNAVDQWLSVENSSRVAVRNNSINRGYAGLEFATGGSDNVFADNTVGPAHIGISVSGDGLKERVLWTRNSIQGAITWGSQIQSDVGGVRNMYFYGNRFENSPANSPAALYPNQGNGFRFNPNVGGIEGVTLDGNVIANNGHIGIQSGDWTFKRLEKLKVVNNVIRANGGAAFTPDFGVVGPFFGDNLLWSGNTVVGNGNNYQPPSEGTFFNNPPSANISAPLRASTGQRILLRAQYAGPAAIGNILWDLGEGLPETASSLSHVYSEPGDYRVSLVVWDALGRAAHDEHLIQVRLDGDFNNDAQVDGADLRLWQTSFGVVAGAQIANGDADSDADVDGRDFLFWQRQFAQGTGNSAVTAVPEPTVGTLVLLAAAAPWRRRRRSAAKNEG